MSLWVRWRERRNAETDALRAGRRITGVLFSLVVPLLLTVLALVLLGGAWQAQRTLYTTGSDGQPLGRWQERYHAAWSPAFPVTPRLVSTDGEIVHTDDQGRTRSLSRISTSAREEDPALSPGGDLLFFASDRVGGAGGFDLYWARRQGDGYSAPTSLGPSLNTMFQERSPSVAPLGGGEYLLLFTSNRHTGYVVDHDLYMSRGRPGGEWSQPRRLLALSSAADERSAVLEPGGSALYFTRPGRGGIAVHESWRIPGGWSDAQELATLAHARNDASLSFEAERQRLVVARDGQHFATRLTLLRPLPVAPIQMGPAALLLLLALLLVVLRLLASRWRGLEVLYRCLLLSVLVHVLLWWWFHDHPVRNTPFTAPGSDHAPQAPIEMSLDLFDSDDDGGPVTPVQGEAVAVAALPAPERSESEFQQSAEPLSEVLPDSAPQLTAAGAEAPFQERSEFEMAVVESETRSVAADAPALVAQAAPAELAAERSVNQSVRPHQAAAVQFQEAPTPALTEGMREFDAELASSDVAESPLRATPEEPSWMPREPRAAAASVRPELEARATPRRTSERSDAVVQVREVPTREAAARFDARGPRPGTASVPAPVVAAPQDTVGELGAPMLSRHRASDASAPAPQRAVARGASATPRVSAAPSTQAQATGERTVALGAAETSATPRRYHRETGRWEQSQPGVAAMPGAGEAPTGSRAAPTATPPTRAARGEVTALAPPARDAASHSAASVTRPADAPQPTTGEVAVKLGAPSRRATARTPGPRPRGATTPRSAANRKHAPQAPPTLAGASPVPELERQRTDAGLSGSLPATTRDAAPSVAALGTQPGAPTLVRAGGGAVLAGSTTERSVALAPRRPGPRPGALAGPRAHGTRRSASAGDAAVARLASPVSSAEPAPAMQRRAVGGESLVTAHGTRGSDRPDGAAGREDGAPRELARARSRVGERQLRPRAQVRARERAATPPAYSGPSGERQPTARAPEAAVAGLPEASRETPVAEVRRGPQPVEWLAARFGARKLRALQEHGGSQETERAVQKGLRYLSLLQSPDGGWGKATRVDPKYGETSLGKSALALLAFLGAGHFPGSDTEYESNASRALQYLLRNQRADTGHFGLYTSSYTHGIAAYALGEAYLLTRDEQLKAPLELAIRHILRHQLRDPRPFRHGGWSYYYHGPRSFDDYPRVSVSVWQLMALKTALLAGVQFPQVHIDAGKQYLLNSWSSLEGRFLYNRDPARLTSRYPTLPASTPAAAFVLMVLGESRDSEMVRRSMEMVERRPPEGWRAGSTDAFIELGKGNGYFWYYGTLAMFLYGGDSWLVWNAALKETLLPSQSPDGSWQPISVYARHAGDHEFDRTYTTALNVLMLEVYYRYLTPFLEDSARNRADPAPDRKKERAEF